MGDALSGGSKLEPRPSASFWRRCVGVFVSPFPTLQEVGRQPDFLAPLIVLIAASLAVAESLVARIGMERMIRTALEGSSRGLSMTPEQMDQAVSQGLHFAGVTMHVGAVLGPPILLLMLAGVGLAVVNGVFGGELNFKTAFSIACYAKLVAIAEAVMALALIWFGDPENLNPQNPAPSNAGFFLDPFSTPKPLLALASLVDVFTVWSLVLLGIGLSAAAGGKVYARGVVLTLLGVWLLYVLARVGLAMLL